MTPSRFPRLGLGLLAACLLTATATLAAGEGGFTATLSIEQRDLAGLTTLTPDERSALDQLVADDLAFARRENITELDGTFVTRRTEGARQQAGLDRLSPEQLAKLNELVAAAIASRPAPRERPRLKESDVLAAKRRGEIHGSVTLAYGWGSGGREFRAGSLWLDYYDPESRFGLGVGISTIEGDGYYGYHPGHYYPGVHYPGFYDYDFYSPPVYFPNSAFRPDARGGFFHDDHHCFRAIPTGGFGGRGGGRRR